MTTGSFWARRRAAVAAEERAEAEAQQAAQRAEHERTLAERTDEEILAELELPDPDVSEDPAELRRFLTAAVPQRLKTRALRRMWRLNPVLANLDGLVEYGEDYTDKATVIEGMKTAYQVGKGMLARFEEMTEDNADAAPVVEAEAEPEAEQEAPEIEPAAPYAFADDDTQDAVRPTAPRRMRFSFDT